MGDFERSRDSIGSGFHFLFSIVGNLKYCAPEMIIGAGYDERAEWWAIGVLTFNLLSGTTPFEDKSGSTDITMENIFLNESNWNVLPTEVSPPCLRFMSELMESDPSKRLGGQRSERKVLTHEFFSLLDMKSIHSKPGPYIPLLNTLLPCDENFYHLGDLNYGQYWNTGDNSAGGRLGGGSGGTREISDDEEQLKIFENFSYVFSE